MIATTSLGRKLTLLLAGVAALLSVLSWSMVTGLARQAAERTQDNVLSASVTTIAETLRTEQGEVRLELPYSAFSMLGAISQDRVFYKVVAGSRLLTGYADLQVPSGYGPDQGPGRVRFATGSYLGEDIRMASLTRFVQAGNSPVPVTVTVAQTRYGIGAITSDLSRHAAGLSIAFFLVAAGLTSLVARASLRPLKTITADVARRGPADLSPLHHKAPAELAPLLDALNRLMVRLGQSIRRSEDFIAEAAHRVRTPLATVRVQAEILLRATTGDAERQRLRQMIRAVDESSRSAGQLLDHATVVYRAEALARDPVDLGEVARQCAHALEPTAAMRDIALRIETQRAIVRGDPILIDNALRNILDNAIKYSPDDTTVTVRVLKDVETVRVSVTDQGPGLGNGAVEHLTERFRRGCNVEGIVGSGLGLTIAEAAIQAHGGRLELGKGPEGQGACVSLILSA
ncbi:sensor histidine kinase [Roseibium aquae]|uniref:histidine kinase n=1 Tax=Roseibium aquae TaxID=1323746 RepID=A0A916TKK9_9HYPH|nr:sensor histidine kinase [Roseibium aquae]GGB45780.1 sensor histidine kinase [Roseibium aquae]